MGKRKPADWHPSNPLLPLREAAKHAGMSPRRFRRLVDRIEKDTGRQLLTRHGKGKASRYYVTRAVLNDVCPSAGLPIDDGLAALRKETSRKIRQLEGKLQAQQAELEELRATLLLLVNTMQRLPGHWPKLAAAAGRLAPS